MSCILSFQYDTDRLARGNLPVPFQIFCEARAALVLSAKFLTIVKRFQLSD